MLSKVNSFWWSVVRNKPLILSIVSGFLGVAAFPPLPFAFFLLFFFVPFLAIIEEKFSKKTTSSGRQEKFFFRTKPYLNFFKYSYIGFFIWNLGTCYWLMLTSLSVSTRGEAIEAFVAGFLAVALNPILQSIPWLLYIWLRRRIKLEYALIAWGAFYLAFEYLHLNWDLTWSWITLGHGFTFFPGYIQYIEWTGVLGISAFILLSNGFIFWIIKNLQNKSKFEKSNYKHLATLLLILITPLIIGSILLNPSRDVYRPIGKKIVRVIQPNIDPYKKFAPGERKEQILEALKLINTSPKVPGKNPKIIILPETFFPASIHEQEVTTDDQVVPIRLLTEADSIDVVSGAVVYSLYKGHDNAPPGSRLIDESAELYYQGFNAAFVVGDTCIYIKAKLVPFTERTPFLNSLEFLKSMSIDLGGSFGNFGLPDSLISLPLPFNKTRIAPIICYESEFGDHVRTITSKGTTLMCIITNDGWFGKSGGHIQHAYFSVLRSIENRRWIARSANTGMSLFCSPQGNVTQTLGWWQQGILDQEVELLNGTTFYMLYGDFIGKISVWFAIAFICIGIRNGIMKKK